MKHGSVFSGIGGFDLAAQWMGWDNVFHCEIDEFCRKILGHYWPKAKSYEDITKTDFTIYRGQIDILTGGDPCQPSSIAGLGKGTEDDRYLWPQMFRAIREIHPTWIVNENVNGTITNGILDLKIDDLENEGYTCQAYCLPAEAVGALHRRERVWLIANNTDFSTNNRGAGKIQETGKKERISERNKIQFLSEPVNLWAEITDTDIERQQEFDNATEPENSEKRISGYFGFGPDTYGNIPRHVIESSIIRMLDGLPEGLDYTKRNQRIKALGNAIVPQIAYQLFKAIAEMEEIGK